MYVLHLSTGPLLHAYLISHLAGLRPFRIIHSALCSRVLLNLRKVAAKLTDMSIEDFRQSRIAFGPGILDGQHTSYLMDLELDTLEDYR